MACIKPRLNLRGRGAQPTSVTMSKVQEMALSIISGSDAGTKNVFNAFT